MLPFDIINIICYSLSNVDVNNFLSTSTSMYKLKFKIKFMNITTLNEHLISLPYYDNFTNLYVDKLCKPLPKNIKYITLNDSYALAHLDNLNFDNILLNLAELKISSNIFDQIKNKDFVNKIKCINICNGLFDLGTVYDILKLINTRLILNKIFLNPPDLAIIPKNFINNQQKINLSYFAHTDSLFDIFQNKISIFQNKIDLLDILINHNKIIKSTFDNFIIPNSVTVLRWSKWGVGENCDYAMQIVSNKLKIYYYFNNILDYIDLFPAATHIKCNSSNNIPSHITHLTFGDHFNALIGNSLPNNLEYLKLGKHFNWSEKYIIPKNLKMLDITNLNYIDAEKIYEMIGVRTNESVQIKLLVSNEHINKFKNSPPNVTVCLGSS